jgi:hypothetical protein
MSSKLNIPFEEKGNLFLRDNAEDRKMNIYKEGRLMVEQYKNKLISYVAAILDPEYTFNSGIMVKQPNLVNIPSVTITTKTFTTLETTGSRSCCISWNPALFCTKDALGKIQIGTYLDNDKKPKPVTANMICSTLYSIGAIDENALQIPCSSLDAPVKGIPDNLPEVGVAKARLVSAKIKISFRGPVLVQGGTVMGAATYLGPPGIIAKADANDGSLYLNEPINDKGRQRTHVVWGDLFGQVEGQLFDKKVSPFEEKNLSNGIWAKNVNITKDANGISAVFIPSDPMDEIFYKTGTYYGEDVNQKAVCTNDRGTTIFYSDKGARLSYLFNLQGLPKETNAIGIETYTNWEVLPTTLAASALRNNRQNMMNAKMVEDVKTVLNEYFKENTGLHTVQENYLGGFWNKLGKIITTISE